MSDWLNDDADPVVEVSAEMKMLRQILSKVSKLEAKLCPVEVDIDGQYGDPEVRLVPKKYDKEEWKGKKYSECPASFLKEMAGLLEWIADKEEEQGKVTDKGKPCAPYTRANAAKARAWAARAVK